MKICIKIILMLFSILLIPLLYNISKMNWNMKYEGYYIHPAGVLSLGILASCIITMIAIKLPLKKKV